jgi:methyl-accepting chemotaxis protein
MINKRKRIVVNRALQYRIAGLVVASGVAIMLFAFVGLYILSTRLIEVLETAAPGADVSFLVINEINHILVLYAPLVAASLVTSWVAALYLSNRIAGPVYNMERVLDEFAEGKKTSRIVLRKDDFMGTLAERINRALDAK